MNLQTMPIQQQGSQLKIGEIYWITTSHERQRDYIYEGVIDGSHCFFRNGAIIDSMRRIFVPSESFNVSRKDVHILKDDYKLNSVGKDENPEEYQRLENLWRVSGAK
jgi:hypothetical protein